MKKITSFNYWLVLIFLTTFQIKAQNLVIDPSIETYTGSCGFAGYGSLSNWYNPSPPPIDSCSSPDWYVTCGSLPFNQAPNAYFGYQAPHSGNAYAAFILKDASSPNYREYVEGHLSSPLVAGQTYCVSFYISLGNKSYLYCNNFGIYISNSLTTFPWNNCSTTAPLPFVPQINYTCTIQDTANWVRVQGNYTAVGGEQYFTIGNFFNDAATTSGTNPGGSFISGPFAYYYVDDVSITPGACCYADITPPLALCSDASPITLTATGSGSSTCASTVTGTWSGTGITNSSTGTFDPSVAGTGTHVVTYSMACGYAATTTITVNACATLSVCQSGGYLVVSGGTPTYTWNQWDPGGTTPITTQAECTACNSSYTWISFSNTCLNGITPVTSCTTPASWQQIATGSTITPTGTYPLQIVDASSNTYTVTSLASVPTCSSSSTCPTLTITVASQTNIACFGGNTGAAVVGASGGASAYTYTWMPGSLTDSTQTGLSAGVYTVNVLDANNCPGSGIVTITQPADITNTITVTNASCGFSNGSATVTTGGGTGSYTYTWSPSGGNATTADSLAAGVYTVQVTDANNCTAFDTATIIASSSPTITIIETPYCTGDSTTLTASGATSYTWSPSTNLSDTTSASVTATPTTTTIYTVTGFDGTCTGTNTISVGPNTFTVNTANICLGDSATLIASNPNLTYTWTPATGLNQTDNDTVKAGPTSTTVYTITSTFGTSCTLTVTDSVIVHTKPMISVLSPTVCSATSATITASGASTYTWMPSPDLTPSVTSDTAYVNFPTTPGTYTVVGSDAYGCTDTAVSSVTISSNLGIVSATPNYRCYGDYIELFAIGASTYTWTSNDTNNLHFNPTTGYYVITDTANVGTYTIAIYGESHTGTFCNGYDTITLTIHPTPTVTAVAPSSYTICAGSSVTLNTTTGGAISYTWSPAAGLSSTSSASTTATPPATSTYVVTGSNSFGCTDAATFNVTVIPIPTFNVSSADYCLGGSATLTITPTTSDAATYTWTPAATLSTNTGTVVTANPSTTTIYTVTATTNIANCSSLPQTTTVTVHQPPVITITPSNTTICSNTSTSLVASNTSLSYTWSPASAINGAANTATITTANPATATTYTAIGTDGFGCQSNAATAVVNVTDISSTASATAACAGQTINLGGNTLSGASYQWNGPGSYSSTQQNPAISNATAANAGTYTLTVTRPVGCVATSTVLVTVNSLPSLSVTNPTTVCPNAATTLTASSTNPNLTYTWSPATDLNTTTGNAVTAITASTEVYTVIGTDGNGCSSTKSTTLTVAPISASISATPSSGDFPLDVQFSNLSTGGAIYVWNYGNGTATYTTTSLSNPNTNTTYTAAGTYTVSMIAYNSFGCPDTSRLTVIVYEGYTMTIPNIFTPNGDGVNDNFFVKATGLASIEIVIYDRWGLKKWESTSASDMWDGKNATDGTYFYIIKATSTRNETKEYKGFITLVK